MVSEEGNSVAPDALDFGHMDVDDDAERLQRMEDMEWAFGSATRPELLDQEGGEHGFVHISATGAHLTTKLQLRFLFLPRGD